MGQFSSGVASGMRRGLGFGFRVVIKWGYKSPGIGYMYSYPTYSPVFNIPPQP